MKEDKREVLVGKRREGKTTALLETAIGKARDEGVNVLFATLSTQASNYAMTQMIGIIGRDASVLTMNKAERKITFKTGSIKSVSLETVKSRDFYNNYDYKILDNAAFDSYDFDLISVNGTIKNEQ